MRREWGGDSGEGKGRQGTGRQGGGDKGGEIEGTGMGDRWEVRLGLSERGLL